MYLALASYRDPLLQSTIDSAFANATYPEKLTVGCFLTVMEDDPSLQKQLVSNDYGGKVFWETEPAGTVFSVTRARNKSIKWLTPEHEYVIQVDSHSRFLPGWDVQLIDAYNELATEKALFSTYVPSWFPNEDGTETFRPDPNKNWINFAAYNTDQSKRAFFDTYELVPEQTGKHNPSGKTARAWHVAGMFKFASAKYFLEFPQPEWIVFWGEELYNSLRVFTHGWDVYVPDVMPIRQMYPQDVTPETNLKIFGRAEGPHKNWVDFGDLWGQAERASTDRIIDAILNQTVGPEHLGTERSLDSLYEFIGYDLGELFDGWRKEYKALH